MSLSLKRLGFKKVSLPRPTRVKFNAPSAQHIAVSLWLTGAGKKKKGLSPLFLIRSLSR
jgi:hypothetical protein